MSSLITRYQESRNLPLGHYERDVAERAVKAEYLDCTNQERAWVKSLSSKAKRAFARGISVEQARSLVDYICDSTGEKRIKKIILSSPDVIPGAGAHYYKNQIHFKSNYIFLSTLLHELTHHFGEYGHGKKFCELEKIIFEVAEIWIKGNVYDP